MNSSDEEDNDSYRRLKTKKPKFNVRKNKKKSYYKRNKNGDIKQMQYYSDDEVDGVALKSRPGVPEAEIDNLNRSTPNVPWKMFNDKKFAG